jgi:hypothetical protein
MITKRFENPRVTVFGYIDGKVRRNYDSGARIAEIDTGTEVIGIHCFDCRTVLHGEDKVPDLPSFPFRLPKSAT